MTQRLLVLLLATCASAPALRAQLVIEAAPVQPAAQLGAVADAADDEEQLPSFALPTLSEVDRESYVDFQRYVAEGDWSRAFRSIEAQLEDPPHGLIAGEGGVRFSWPERLRRDLAALPPEGRRAFRLFHDAHAASLLEVALDESRARELRREHARLIYDAWYPTASGDDAAHLLAQFAMEDGRAALAARLWRGVLREHPDTDLDRGELRLSLLEALGAAGDAEGFEAEAARARARYAAGGLVRDGETIEVEAWLASIAPVPADSAWPPLIETIGLSDRPEPRWRARFDRYQPEARNSSWQAPSRPVPPPSALFEDLFLVSRDGEVDALSLADGERAWSFGRQPSRSSSVGQAAHFPLLGRPGLWVAGTNPMGQRGEPRAELLSFDPRTGHHERVGPEGGIWNERHALGKPALGSDALFAVVGETESYRWHLARLDVPSGEMGWFVELGAPASSANNNPWMWSGNLAALPVHPCLEVVGDELFVMTDSGALLSADVDTGLLRWAYPYAIRQRFDQAASPGSLLFADGLLYFRSAGCPEIFALDPAGPELLWSANVGKDERIVAIDAERIVLAGDELRAVSRLDGSRLWSRPLMLAAGTGSVLQSEELLWILTRRGLFEIDKESGHHRRVWRGDLSRLGGGDLLWTDRGLVAVGPDQVLCYGEHSEGATDAPDEASSAEDEESTGE